MQYHFHNHENAELVGRAWTLLRDRAWQTGGPSGSEVLSLLVQHDAEWGEPERDIQLAVELLGYAQTHLMEVVRAVARAVREKKDGEDASASLPEALDVLDAVRALIDEMNKRYD